MAGSARQQANSIRECGGMLSRLTYRRAKSEGVDVAPLLAHAGLTTAIIEDRNARVGVADQIEFVDRVAKALGDKNLGFHLAFDHDVREMGLLYYVAASADTLGTALRRVERFSGIQNEGVRIKVTRGKTVRVSFDYSGVARHTDVQQIEFIIGSMLRIFRQLTSRTLTPTRVQVMHRIGDDKRELERLLDSTIEDDSDADRIEFPASSWNLPLISADPHLHRLCVQRCEEALAGRAKSASPLKVQVENAIAALLPHGQARHDVVSAQLGMSPRTLARRLSSEGSSFAGILEEVRSALAQRYLADRALAISEIAWLLGYAEMGTFTRAYQRWTGMPPSAARARQQRPAGRSVQ
jgi:AraC-like DNA-binding protein